MIKQSLNPSETTLLYLALYSDFCTHSVWTYRSLTLHITCVTLNCLPFKIPEDQVRSNKINII